MFTGLIESVGTVARADRRSDALVLKISDVVITSESVALGDSIAVNGVCLTVTSLERSSFEVLAGAETLERTTLSSLRVASKVNLERAMRVGDRLGGHIVQGHVDGVAQLRSRQDMGANLVLGFEPPQKLLRYMVEKGSICIDGVSLTINEVDERSFSVALIPHTVEKTSLHLRNVGDALNIEVDMIGKYVERLLQGYQP